MAELFGQSMSRMQILERVGNIAQLCDARMMEFTEGRATGVRTVEVTTGSGFAFTIVPSRCLDISRASFKGVPLAWQSAVGETSPFSYQPEGMEWLRGFFGGLLTTCGLSYSSHPCEDEGELLGLHGRAANIPAEDVAVTRTWDGDEYRLSISGIVREVGVFKDNLVLHRTIETSLGASTLRITDRIRNAGFRDSPLMMLYHINPGWPIVSEHSHLIAPVGGSTYFDENARSEPDQWSSFLPPQENYSERCYLHDMVPDRNGSVRLALVNETMGIGVSMTYPKAEFPRFIQWKMMNRGEYVVGIEPGNITGNRVQMRADGTLEMLAPGEERTFSIELGVLSGIEEIKNFTRSIKELTVS